MDHPEVYIPLPEQISDAAQEFYTNLPYHNFEHSQEVFDEAMRLADICAKNGVYVNRKVLTAAAFLHDANFHIDSSDRFKTKEEYTQYICGHILPFLGYDENETRQVEVCVDGTELGQPCTTLEAKIIRRADIGNVSSNRNRFLSKTFAFTKEEIQLKGIRNVSLESIIAKTRYVFSTYLKEEDLRLGDFDDYEEGGLKFIGDCWRNIDAMAHETYESLLDIGREAVETVLGKHVSE